MQKNTKSTHDLPPLLFKLLFPWLYKAKAAKPAMMAPALMSWAVAPPVKVADGGEGLEPPPTVLFGDAVPLPTVPLPRVPLPAVPATSVKLAQVRRVALLVWTTTERLPKKDAGPLAVER